jgi:HK97 family phage portal protein
VRTCVDFLARNIAHLGLHVFRRIGETDRERLRDHPLARILAQPLPSWAKVTRYRLIHDLVADLGVYWNAFWLKMRTSEQPEGLLRLPPEMMSVHGTLVPEFYELSISGTPKRLECDEVVHFRGYNAANPVWGLSPLETLRRVLAEEHAAGDYRENFWANAARMGGVIERPAPPTAPEWSAQARERFKAEFEQLYSGAANSGKTAVLEEGMTWRPMSFNAQESEYLAGRKLTREECARAYHIPLPMVGILDHATFSNIREQHKNLYQDSLGPWLAMIEQEIELQLLPDMGPSDGVYCEFNIQEKLAGSFEEKTAAYQTAVGRPYMTVNEVRARENLPSMGGDADELVTPLNMMTAGQAEAAAEAEPAPEPPPAEPLAPDEGTAAAKSKKAKVDPTLPRTRARHREQWALVYARHFSRQRDAVLSKLPKGRKINVGEIWEAERWNRELKTDVKKLSTATATVWARYVADQMDTEFPEDSIEGYLEEHARIVAENINATTADGIAKALKGDSLLDDVKRLFEVAIAVRAAQEARSSVTAMANFGAQEGAKAGGIKSKTWQVNSGNPRPEHAAMNGETVDIGDVFSNGMRWPGDPAGGAENNSNCECSVIFER